MLRSQWGRAPIRWERHVRGVQNRANIPFIRGCLKTDCADRSGLDELRHCIEHEIDALPHLRDGFPSEWFAVKDRLPQLRRNLVSFEEYRKECRRLQVTSEF